MEPSFPQNFPEKFLDALSSLNIKRADKSSEIDPRPRSSGSVDLVMNKFAADFSSENAYFNFSNDACYLLGYNCLMLSTDLHAPARQRRMTKEEFVKASTGLNDGNDFNRELIEILYDRIAEEKIPD